VRKKSDAQNVKISRLTLDSSRNPIRTLPKIENMEIENRLRWAGQRVSEIDTET